MDHQVNNRNHHEFRPKGERRVRFADSVGLELVSIFLLYQKIFLWPKQISNEPHHAATNANKQQPSQSPPSQSSLQDRQQQQSANSHQITQSQSQPQTQHHQQQQHLMAGQQGSAKRCQQEVVNQFNNKTNHLYQNSANYNYNYNYNYNSSVNNHNHNSSSTTTTTSPSCYQPPAQYIRQFTQPISLVSFRERVKLNKVHLETCSFQTGSGNITVSCTIRVLNLSYEKSVLVRYTTDEWHSFTDSLATFLPTSCDGWSDRFSAAFSVKELQTGQRLMLAIKYTYNGDQVSWDNNGGLNYTIKRM